MKNQPLASSFLQPPLAISKEDEKMTEKLLKKKASYV